VINSFVDEYRKVYAETVRSMRLMATPIWTVPSTAQQPEAAEEEEEEEDGDKVTKRLMADALKTHGRESCPKCGNRGSFIRMALVCPTHGAFAGV
jgi:ribosomal protein L32